MTYHWALLCGPGIIWTCWSVERRMPSVLWLECARRTNFRDISGSDLERFIEIGVKKTSGIALHRLAPPLMSLPFRTIRWD